MEHNDKPLFEVLTKDGHTFELWLDGHTEGFPEDHLLINRALPLVYKLQGIAASLHSALKQCLDPCMGLYAHQDQLGSKCACYDCTKKKAEEAIDAYFAKEGK